MYFTITSSPTHRFSEVTSNPSRRLAPALHTVRHDCIINVRVPILTSSEPILAGSAMLIELQHNLFCVMAGSIVLEISDTRSKS